MNKRFIWILQHLATFPLFVLATFLTGLVSKDEEDFANRLAEALNTYK